MSVRPFLAASAAAFLMMSGLANAEAQTAPLPPLPPVPQVSPPTQGQASQPPPPQAQAYPQGQPYVPPPPPPPGPPPPPPSCTAPCTGTCTSVCDENKHEWAGVIGVRGSVLNVNGSDHDGLTSGATFTGTGDHHDTKDHISWHASYVWGLGGGTGGLEGGLGLGLAGGFRADVTPNQGPFARIGAMGELWGNDRFYFSRLELPMAEVGYQYLKGDNLFELGGRAAPILGGRYDVGDGARRETSSSYEWGAYLGIHSKLGRLDVAYNRIQLPTRNLDTPIDTIRGEGCIFVIDHVGICVDGHYLRGDVTLPNGTTSLATTVYGGLSLGYATW
jgi:hypothetical protein